MKNIKLKLLSVLILTLFATIVTLSLVLCQTQISYAHDVNANATVLTDSNAITADTVQAGANISNATTDITIDNNNFPDQNFRKWLTASNHINGAGADGILTAEEISNITIINIKWEDGVNVTSLKGIEYFTNLQTLAVTDQLITDLDLSNNTQLTYVNCSYNRLTSLNVANLDKLNYLNCEFNKLTTLDLSDNTELVVLYSRHNLLEYLPLDNNTKLQFIETFDNKLLEIDVTMLTELTFLHIDHNRLTELDMSKNLKLEGGGFVVRNNFVKKVILPEIKGFTVYYDDFAEQDPMTGYARVEWYLDEDYTIPVTGDLEAQGQTLYCKRIANNYTVKFDANGGSNAPGAVNSQYDTQFELPTDTPSRLGYTFAGWAQYKDGTGKFYNAGESVINLAGHKDYNDKITLYAVWQPIPYTVDFNANAEDATGEMQQITVNYGQVFSLPTNQFVKPRHELKGWALSPNGTVKYLDRQAVSNLSADGSKVTLYAVWQLDAESLRQPFVEQLESVFNALDINDYYIEDYNTILKLLNQTMNTLIELNRDTVAMQKAVNVCLNSINSTKNIEQRVAEITQGWQSDFYLIINKVNANRAINVGEGQLAYNEVTKALNSSDRVALSKYSTLTNIDSINSAVDTALVALDSVIAKLNNYRDTALWQISADNYATLDNSAINSTMVPNIQEIVDAKELLSQESLAFVSTGSVDRLNYTLRISQSKYDAVLKLHHEYELLQQQPYSPESWQQVTALYNQSLVDIEQASSLSNVQTTLQQSITKIQEVPLEQPTEPSEPQEPSEPSEPQEPEEPQEPSEPNNPEQPDNPQQPSEPDEPTNPEQPDNPQQPSEPSNPDGQDKPSGGDNQNPTTPDDNKVLIIVLSVVGGVVLFGGVSVTIYFVVKSKKK